MVDVQKVTDVPQSPVVVTPPAVIKDAPVAASKADVQEYSFTSAGVMVKATSLAEAEVLFAEKLKEINTKETK
jgi:hypothetical protein